MPRPVTDRQVGCPLARQVFKPAGVPARELEEVTLGLDGAEALRLADLEGLYHDAAALRMGVSRQTFGRIVEAARRHGRRCHHQREMPPHRRRRDRRNVRKEHAP